MLGTIKGINKTTDNIIFENRKEVEKHQNKLDYIRGKELIFLSQK